MDKELLPIRRQPNVARVADQERAPQHVLAPAAVRATFPQANPSIYLTASLGITFPFMLILGIPIVYEMAAFWQGL
jgi:hypothetical protein